MTNGTKQATPPAMNAASPTDDLAELRSDLCKVNRKHDVEHLIHQVDAIRAALATGSAAECPTCHGAKVVGTPGMPCPFCPPELQGSATSGEGDCYCGGWGDVHQDSCPEVAALAAKAEQSITAGAAKGGITKTESAEQRAGLAPVAWRRVAWIDGTWIFTDRQPSEEIAWEPLFATPVAERATTKGENDERVLPAASGSDAPAEHAVKGVGSDARTAAGASPVAERAAAPASVEPADLRDVIEFALDLAENEDAQAAINFLTAWNWESDAFLRVHWPEFGELEAATRSRAKG